MRITFKIILLGGILAISSGCVSSGNQSAQQRLPERFSMPPQQPAKTIPQEGSIFGANQGLDLYADGRANKIGDIILVRVVESSSGKKEANTKTERESTTTGGISSLFGFLTWVGEKNSRYTPSLTNIQATLTNDFEGKADTNRKSDVTATLSARVTDITADGNLLIRGYQEVRVNNETQHIILSGMVRPADVSSDNSVLSSRIADSRIEYSGTGALNDKQQPGWLARTLDVVFPF